MKRIFNGTAKPLGDERGFSITSVLAAAGLLMIIVVSAMSFLGSYSKTLNDMDATLQKAALAQDLRVQVSHAPTCYHAFKDQVVSKNIGDWTHMTLNALSIGKAIPPGSDLPEYKLSEVTIAMGITTSLGKAPNGNDRFLASLQILAKTRSGRELKQTPAGLLMVELNGSSQMVGCQAEGSGGAGVVPGGAGYPGTLDVTKVSDTKDPETPECPIKYNSNEATISTGISPSQMHDTNEGSGYFITAIKSMPNNPGCVSPSPKDSPSAVCQSQRSFINVHNHQTYKKWASFTCKVEGEWQPPSTPNIEGNGGGYNTFE